MGDASSTLTITEARHLLRRTWFGATPDQLRRYTGLTRGEAADRLLDFEPSNFRPYAPGDDEIGFRALRDSWIRYILRSRVSLQEKLVLFWHDHFATSFLKVHDTELMADQNQLLRRSCQGNFKTLVKDIGKDPAMMVFLDTVLNDVQIPNENYARELQELFTLGITDLNGQPNYEQADVVQIARAFTGWTSGKNHRRGEIGHLNDWNHDYMVEWPERGPKVIYRTRGGFGPGGRDFTQPDGEGAVEIDQVVDAIFEHRDSDGASTVARHITRKLLQYFAHSTPAKAEVDAVIGLSGFDASWDISALVRAILVSDVFYATAPGPGYDVSSKKSVKWPIDYMIGTMRLLRMKFVGHDQRIDYSSFKPARTYLLDMGQDLFAPPSVFGWDWEVGWVSTAALLSRYRFAVDLVSARGSGRSGFRPHALKPIRALMRSSPVSAGSVVDAVAEVFGVNDQLTSDERDILIDYLGGPGATLDLNDEVLRNTKLHGVFALVMQSSAYQLQ